MSRSPPYRGFVHYEPRSQTGVQHRTNMTQRDEVQKFEQGRIRFLQEERLHIQKKTFTKWMNSFLQKARMEVDDLFVDLADGKKLLKLLEIISGEKLAKPNNGKMRVHKIENVNKSLTFLHTKVRLESIGAEDIVDGNPRLILGLIWTIILRFQIQEIEIDVDEENESSEKKSAKDALLLWAQRKTNGYRGVDIHDFSTSWRNGLGFNALIHAHRPDLFDYNNLLTNRNIDNLNHAFDVANNELGIPRLLDAEDIDTSRPDEKSIMTYVASYYHTFARMKNEEKSGRRIAKIISQMVDADKMKIVYDKLTTDLLDWIKTKTIELENRDFPNSLEGIQTLFVQFGQYRTQEKPPKYIERSEIEALFFNINTQLKELHQPQFIPNDGKLIQDIERTWEILERAEYCREVALRNELLRQQRLEQLYYKFERKSILREGYLKEMIQVLSDQRYGSNLQQVDATLKKHEAISADIMAREERVHDLTQMSNELIDENYRNKDLVKRRELEILEQWNLLLKLLEKHKINLNRIGNIMGLCREIDTTYTSIQQLYNDMLSNDTGVHLIAVEELLQKHALQELQVTSLGETERRLHRTGENLQIQNPKEKDLLKGKLDELSEAYKKLQDAAAHRKNNLEEARNFYQFLQDQEDEEAWLIEKQRICQAAITAKDLRTVLSLQQKHKALIDEIKARKNKYDQRAGMIGKQLIDEQHPRSIEIEQHIERNGREWLLLEKLAKERAKQLQDAVEAYQFYTDANETDSWLNEKTSILKSKDYGSDEPSAQALLQRHKDLECELDAYKGDINSLNLQADRLINAGISYLNLTQGVRVNEPQIEEIAYEYRMVPTEVWEDEPVEKVEYKMVTQERRVPQVKALYPFNDHGLTMIKGEIMYLLNKSNPDWWCVRKADGTDGFAPANYVVEIEPRLIQIQVKQPQTVKQIRKVKKTKMIKQKVPVKIVKSKQDVHQSKINHDDDSTDDDNNSVPKRQKHINDTYNYLKRLAIERRALLEDAIRLFRFYKECDDLDKWIKDKEKLLTVNDTSDSVEQAKRKYEKFVTDLSATSKRMDELGNVVDEFEKQHHSQIDKVRQRYRQIQAAWQRLNQLKLEKEKNLEGASSVELFNKTCDEAKDWMYEKMKQLESDVLAHDLKTVQALQRRHDNLERELSPIEEKVNKIMLLANTVKSTYPNEKQNVLNRQDEIELLWQQVKDKALKRRARLEDAVGQQIFTNSCKDLLHWIGQVKDNLNTDNTVRDVQTAGELIKNHQDLYAEIKAKDDEFKQVTNLGQKLLKSNPNLDEIRDNIERLNAEQAAIDRGWKEKQQWLQQCLELQLFNKEADNIDANTSAHQAFLEFSDLGSTLDEVEALQKQHRAFVNTLFVQDERVNAFSKKADNLIANQHYDSKGIDDKRNQVIERRQAVKDSCQRRTNALDASKNYQEFRAEVQDLQNWLSEKLKTVSDESYRDLTNLERKLKKHEAFECELRANEGQLRTVNKLGQALIAQNNYQKDDIIDTLRDLNEQWQKLVGLSLEKGRRLRQAITQHGYNNSINDINNRLNDVEKNLQNVDVGNDLRSCRELLKKHELLENELNLCQSRVDELNVRSNDMVDDDHFDTDTIKKRGVNIQEKLEELLEPMNKRRAQLEEALKFYKFGFELDTELQWIKEHLPMATSDLFGNDLHQAQNLYKKHKKLEAEINGHQPVIDKTITAGQKLIEQQHPESVEVKRLCQVLTDAWLDLCEKAKERAQKLELSLKAQQFFFEANEVESWLNEKADMLASTDYGRDRNSATKLLTKHKALELELDTYKNIIAEMGRGAQTLIQNKNPESKVIAERQSSLEHLVRSLQRKAIIRQQRLMESLFRHEYFLESSELEQWIAENLQQASSEDYGQDYEHLLVLQAKFDDLKHRIEAGSERFRQCESLAEKLIANDSSYATEIENEQHNLEKSWQMLHDQMKNRERRLHAAGEIHCFHRDVADALQRIHEKNTILSTEDLGRDLNSALMLLRKHEAFENELVALEAQLQLLVEDASKLQKIYPSNKANIQQQQELVVNAWNNLKEHSDLRNDQLRASVDLQKFLTQIRDLMNWAIGLRLSMDTDDNVRNISRAQLLRTEHDQLKIEIEAREKDFHTVNQQLNIMEENGHYAINEAVERYRNLLIERDKLHTAWQLKKVHLDQLCDLHMFLREAKLIEDQTNAQEITLKQLDFGDTVNQVQDQVKKHEEFEKLIQHQDEKLEQLKQTGEKLIKQKHFDSEQIKKRLIDIENKRKLLHQLYEEKKSLLNDALLYVEFKRDVGEALVWINDRQKSLEINNKTITNNNNNNNNDTVNGFEDKIKKLQKHQAFQAEITANQERIELIKNNGELLINKKHHASNDIKQQLNELNRMWWNLLNDIELIGKDLEEARDILEFNQQLDKIESWIRDKEIMLQASDFGNDYEHCQALIRKLDDVDSDMRIDDLRIKNINQLGDKLIQQGYDGVKERRDNFVKKWYNLQGELNRYRNNLLAASDIHLFDHNVQDTLERIQEKHTLMEIDDLGRDLITVELLQRKQEAIESDLIAVENKLQDHGQDAIILSDKYPHCIQHLQDKMDLLQNKWERLMEAKEKRRNLLKYSYNKHKFIQDVKDLEQWVNDTIKRMSNNYNHHKSMNLNEIEAQFELHDELKAEINGRQQDFNKLINFGRSDIFINDTDINDNVDYLIELNNRIQQAWEQCRSNLDHQYILQDYREQINQLNNWLATKEAFLNNDDVGDCQRAVDALIRKHQDFETTLKQQLPVRLDDINNVANKIIQDPKYNSESVENVKQCLNDLLIKQQRLLDKCDERKKILQQSKELQKFLRDLYDIEIWLNQKLQIANDENYREPHNLQNKIQKHTTFEAEILANQQRINNLLNNGNDMIKNGHYAKDEINNRLIDINNDYKHLIELTYLKRDRLNDAYQASLFYRSLDEFEQWLNDVEIQCNSNDTGSDLITVTNLLKRHTILENDIQQHLDNCETINDISQQFIKNKHFLMDEIQQRSNNLITRYHQLKEPLQRRRDLLESTLLLQQFIRDIDDELQWLIDKEPLINCNDFGNSLTTVQNLYKKHQQLETELLARESIVNSLIDRATHLSRSGHRSSIHINNKAKELKEKYSNIIDLASIRRLRLQDALEVQKYYEEASEAETWMRDKRPLLMTKEVGKDEDSTQSLQRKLEALILEVKTFENIIKKLSKTANSLIEREHYDLDNIELKKKQIEDEFEELRKRISEREVRLSEALQYFGFLREFNEVQEWMKEQTAKVDSEEYGNDVEHVELLIQGFDTFHASLLNNGEPRIQSCIQSGNLLIEAKSNYSIDVQHKISDLQNQWDDLLELANARKDALNGAKQVHVFDRQAEEIISWIQEKEANLTYYDTYGQDLDSIRDLIRKHEAFENEMLAIKEKVEYIEQEGEKLINEFPDTKEHIDDKREDMLNYWEDLQQKAEQRKDHLQQAEQLQTYFDQYQDLLAWINEMLAKITAPDLAGDSVEAELLIERHKEHRVEIDARTNILQEFYDNGNQFIKDGHFLADEIQDKINILKQRMKYLCDTWEQRRIIYEQNLDVQLFKREANTLENWLLIRENILKDPNIGDNIGQVEDLIRKHKDFEEAIKAQEDKFEALKRMTMIEEAFALQKEQEALAKKAEKERLEQERLEHRRKQEIQRLADIRRQERQNDIIDERVNGTEKLENNDKIIGKSDKHNTNNNNNIPTVSVRKTNSIAQMFDRERILARRGSDTSVKRAESMKISGGKPAKRTPSFTTKRRGSFKNKLPGGSNNNNSDYIPPVEVESFLDRKQLLIPGQKRAPNRTWKTSYTVLCGQLLCFFKNKDDFIASKACCPPINIYNAICTRADDYLKKKYTFRLTVIDGSEYLFACTSELEMIDWIQKINFRAKLPPSQQLLHFDIPKDYNEFEMSSQSSRTSSPDVGGEQVVLRHQENLNHHHHHHQQQQQQHNNNGNISSSSSSSSPHRHTLGDNRPPLPPPPLPPSSLPPPSPPPRLLDVVVPQQDNNNAKRQLYYPDNNSGKIVYDTAGTSRTEWQQQQQSGNTTPQRPSSIQPGDGAKMSHRIRDLFVRKKRNSSQM